MESSLDPVLGAAFPVFALVGCGVLAGRFRLITAGSSEALNRFVYAFALPARLFVAVYRGSLGELLGSGAFLLGVILATFATAFVLVQRYRILEAETSTGAVLSTAASVVTVSLVMSLLAAR
jgi:predicted permease